MQLKDFTYLCIEHYSGHPEVKAAADILVDHVASGKSFLKDKPGWTKAARKLVASLWMRPGDMFRFWLEQLTELTNACVGEHL